jgi:hypothetical protein
MSATVKEPILRAEFRDLDAEEELLKRLPWQKGIEPFSLRAVRQRKSEIAREIFQAATIQHAEVPA